MSEEKPIAAAPSTPRRPRAWGLAHGESTVALAGLAVAALVVAVLAGASWWTLRTHRATVGHARQNEVGVVGRLVAVSAEALLADDEVTSARRLVSDAAANYGLHRCRIVLGEDTIIADAEPGNITMTVLPETWPLPKGEATGDVVIDAGVATMRVPIQVRGKGEATLEIEAPVAQPAWADWEVQAGIGAIGAFAFAGLLVVYRVMRTRWRGLGAVGDALRSEAQGRATTGSLALSETFGAEAKAWNTLVEERDTLRAKVALRAASEQLGDRGGQGGSLASACDALWQGLIVLDAAARVIYANGAASVLVRAKRDDMIGQPLASFLNDPKVTDAIAQVAAGKTRQRASSELERVSDSGERSVLRVSVRPMRREDSAAAIVVIEDVTQQRVADESRNAFVAQATHELRTPLTNIGLYVELYADEGEKDPLVRSKCINVIGTEARRLERIVSDMLSVSEIEAGALKLRGGEVRLDALFEELEADYRAQATEKGMTLTFDLPPKLPVMNADRDKLMLAMHNLVGNALKYTPAGGSVTVKAEADAANLTLAVQDTGFGIKEEELELVFDKFYRAKDKRVGEITGSGIGLALARQVIRLHGGDITLRSQLDKGSTFTMTVPLTPAGAKKAA